MRFGCCTNMIATRADRTGIEHIEQLSKAGYDYLELPLAQIMDLSEKEFSNLKGQLKKLNIPCEACNNFFPADIRLTGSAVNMEIVYKYVEASLLRASELGAGVIVFGSSGAKNIPEGFPFEEAWEQLVFLMRLINSQVKKHGITIAIEPLNKKESNIVNTLQDGLRLAQEVDGDNIKLLVDYYHFSMENEEISSLKTAEGYIKHVHFARPEGRCFPYTADGENYSFFLRKLKEIGYGDRISIEAYSQDFNKDFSEGLECLKTCSKLL